MIIITEKDDRLLLQFWEDKPNVVDKDGTLTYSINISQDLVKEIDITAHIERAVENVLARRSAPPLNIGGSYERQ